MSLASHPPWALVPGFYSSARLCLGAPSPFSTTHVSMLLADITQGALADITQGELCCVSPGDGLCPSKCLWEPAGLWGFWYHNWWLNIWALLQCGLWPVLSDQAILQFKLSLYLIHSIFCIVSPPLQKNKQQQKNPQTKLVSLVYFSDSKRNWGFYPEWNKSPA